ncbi:MAG: VCBS repeat-containing protein [Phycisphaeraceae bacterium]|nr:VCBS repeat-containing protein [Phycisphaeraceae bacterium]
MFRLVIIMCAATLFLLAAAAQARATWSIILINTRTGEVALGSATCLTNFDLQANTPVLITGVGGATAQSFVDAGGYNRTFIRDRLAAGWSPAAILAALPAFDTGHQTRQYGLCDTHENGRCGTFTGTGAGAWAGGRTGRILASGHLGADIVYAIQGNVLTGEPVVAAAEAAVINTPGDLACRLMAAMEAARAMGGDGRCSCSSGAPTACGAPPPSFAKSAHIAYMLIARTGDRDGCNQVYRMQTTPVRLIAADLNADGFPELIGVNSASSSFSLLSNISTAPGQGAFAAPVHGAGFTAPRDVFVRDVTGNGAPDLLIAVQALNRVSVLPGLTDANGQPTGQFGAAVHLAAGAGTYGVVAADFDGDGHADIAACNFNDDTLTVFRGLGGGAFAPGVHLAVLDGPVTIAAADLDGDGDADLVLGGAFAEGVQIVRNVSPPGGPPALIAEPPLVGSGSNVGQVVIGDLDGDGAPDIACASGGTGALIIFLNSTNFAAQSIAFGPVPGGVGIGDADGDGFADLVGLTRQTTASRLGVFRGLGGGAFAPSPLLVALPNTPGRLDLADVDGDGDLDAVVPIQGSNFGMVVPNVGGQLIYNNGVGCAAGDYFMSFNVANQSAAAPDPVLQLQAQYDAWRAALVGRPDAEQSSATISTPRAPLGAAGPCVQTLTIRLRDWQGQSVPAIPGTVIVAHAPGSAGRAQIAPPVHDADGTISIEILSPWPGGAQGADRFAVRIEPVGQPSPTNRAVTLMPFAALARIPHADFDLDGQRTVADVFAFLAAWFAGGQVADYDGSGTPDVTDIFVFLGAWFAAAP